MDVEKRCHSTEPPIYCVLGVELTMGGGLRMCDVASYMEPHHPHPFLFFYLWKVPLLLRGFEVFCWGVLFFYFLLGEERIGKKRKRSSLDLHAWIVLEGAWTKLLGLGFSDGDVGNLLFFFLSYCCCFYAKFVNNICLLLCIVNNG